MQRNLMTTIHMFKNHPDKSTMKFVVVPIIREVMKLMNDICMDVKDLIKKFAPGQPICEGIHFDFSNLFLYGKPELW